MRVLSTLVVAFAIVSVVHARRADACAQAGPSDGTVAAIGIYVVGTLSFAGKDLVDDNPSAGYGVVETLFNAPAAIGWSLAIHDELNSFYVNRDTIKTEVAFVALHTVLAAHGIYTIAKHRDRKDKAPQAPRPYTGPPGMWQDVSATVTAAPIRDGAGIGVSGTF